MTTSTRENLIAASKALMLQRGYSATGINDICREVGVSKGAFYHSFSSKEELAVAALESFYRDGINHFMALDLGDASREDRLLAFIDAVGEQAPVIWERGCLIGGIASEMAVTSEAMQTSVAEMFGEMASLVARLAGPFVESLEEDVITAAEIGEHFLVVVEGAVVMSRAHNDPNRIRAAIGRFARLLRRLPRKH